VASKAGAWGIKSKEWTDQELKAKSAVAKKQGVKPGPRWTPANGAWTADQIALLGTDHDKVVAQKLDRSVNAVTVKRVKLHIRAFSGNSGGGRDWAASELKLLCTDHDKVIAAKIKRTASAVRQKRTSLKIATRLDRRSRG
jgi:hypothetical protein